MEKTKGSNTSNFWFGFILGGSITIIFAWLLGTKQGRNLFKKVLELSENWEENAISLLKQLEEEYKKEENNIFEKLKIKQKIEKKESTTLPEVVNKIKNRLTF